MIYADTYVRYGQYEFESVSACGHESPRKCQGALLGAKTNGGPPAEVLMNVEYPFIVIINVTCGCEYGGC